MASKQTPESKGYIDVAFEIDKYGKSDRIKIIGGMNTVPYATRKNLVRVIPRSTFPPRLTAGRVEESSPVVVRYYLDHWRTVRSMSGARAQLGGPSANCGSVSVISNHGAFDAT